MDNGPVRKKCASCGEEIVGIIPKWKDGQPICRNCAFTYAPETPKVRAGGNGSGEDRAPLSEEGRRGRRYLWVLAISLLVLAALAGLVMVSSGTLKDEPLRSGAVKTDRVGDACVQNLWILSKALQEGRLPEPALTCPASGRPYDIRDVKGDTAINCPTPGAHKVAALRVSREKPVPEVVP